MFFARGVFDEILNLIESVSEGFPSYSCCFCESSCLFYLSFNSDFYVSKIMHLRASNFYTQTEQISA